MGNEDLNPEINKAKDYQKYLANLNAKDWKPVMIAEDKTRVQAVIGFSTGGLLQS